MSWPYGGHELVLMFGVQPNYDTWVTPTIPIGITDSPDLVNNTNTTPDYSIGDFAPVDLKAGPLETSGRVRIRLLPYAMYFLQCGIRYPGLVRGVAPSYSGLQLPWLTIGLVGIQAGVPQFRDIHVGCKISDLRVSSAERETVTADVGWNALYPFGDTLGLNYTLLDPISGQAQFPVKWHEVEVVFPNGNWSVYSPSLQWTVRNTLRAHYGQGRDPLGTTHRRGPRFIKETTHAVGLQFRARTELSPLNVTENPLTEMPEIRVSYVDSISGFGFTTALTYAKWASRRQEAIGADGLATWTLPGLARGVNIY